MWGKNNTIKAWVPYFIIGAYLLDSILNGNLEILSRLSNQNIKFIKIKIILSELIFNFNISFTHEYEKYLDSTLLRL